ncbi:hypothetical protein [Rhodovibrio salinarum]|uniref:Uncharacterized protein n=1 Tax=Rhodovibrio salinarum TaxID=1087 RepID=A0A934UZH5_9PROT|nr:hypothetical protein [Rhodovibrio salinarum]MBK1697197.1 hypothetical protein [Rhodovibrio salinarum]
MRFIFGLLGLLALLVGLATSGLLAAAAASGQPLMQPLGQIWFTLDAGSLNLVQATIERGLWPPLWQSGVFPLLQQPAPYVALGALALALVLFLLTRAGRKRDHKFG